MTDFESLPSAEQAASQFKETMAGLVKVSNEIQERFLRLVCEHGLEKTEAILKAERDAYNLATYGTTDEDQIRKWYQY